MNNEKFVLNERITALERELKESKQKTLSEQNCKQTLQDLATKYQQECKLLKD